MITCYKCKRDLHEVSEIGEIVRSYDGADFCFCKSCQEELETLDKECEEDLFVRT